MLLEWAKLTVGKTEIYLQLWTWWLILLVRRFLKLSLLLWLEDKIKMSKRLVCIRLLEYSEHQNCYSAKRGPIKTVPKNFHIFYL